MIPPTIKAGINHHGVTQKPIKSMSILNTIIAPSNIETSFFYNFTLQIYIPPVPNRRTPLYYLTFFNQICSSAAFSIPSSSSNLGYGLPITACSSSHILLRVNASDFNVCSRFDGFSSHSQMVMQCQPISANRFCVSTSLSWFRLIFAIQNSLLELGILQQSELFTSPFSLFTSTLCPCQKHPFTKIQVRYFFSTKSGCPGKRGELSLYRNPLLHSPFRTIISGFVSLEWIAAIVLCRCSGESLSIRISQSKI